MLNKTKLLLLLQTFEELDKNKCPFTCDGDNHWTKTKTKMSSHLKRTLSLEELEALSFTRRFNNHKLFNPEEVSQIDDILGVETVISWREAYDRLGSYSIS